MQELTSLHYGWDNARPAPDAAEKPAQEGANGRQEGGSHYTQMQVQPWQVIDSWPVEQRVGFYRGNALKYIMRMGTKDEQLQEAKKARHYLDKLIETLGG
jgi:hypothetical protein